MAPSHESYKTKARALPTNMKSLTLNQKAPVLAPRIDKHNKVHKPQRVDPEIKPGQRDRVDYIRAYVAKAKARSHLLIFAPELAEAERDTISRQRVVDQDLDKQIVADYKKAAAALAKKYNCTLKRRQWKVPTYKRKEYGRERDAMDEMFMDNRATVKAMFEEDRLKLIVTKANGAYERYLRDSFKATDEIAKSMMSDAEDDEGDGEGEWQDME